MRIKLNVALKFIFGSGIQEAAHEILLGYSFLVVPQQLEITSCAGNKQKSQVVWFFSPPILLSKLLYREVKKNKTLCS